MRHLPWCWHIVGAQWMLTTGVAVLGLHRACEGKGRQGAGRPVLGSGLAMLFLRARHLS